METYQIAFIPELKQGQHHLHAVRMTGRLSFLDTAKRYCQFEDSGSFLVVDLSLVEMSSLQLDHLIQVFGILEPISSGGKNFPNCTDSFYLAAKVIRNVDGLDMHLFREATLYRRDFLQQQI